MPEVFSETVLRTLTTVSSSSELMPQETGTSRTLGVPHGEMEVSSPLPQVTLVVFVTLPVMLIEKSSKSDRRLSNIIII